MIVSRAEMTALEESVFATGVDAEALMERVGRAMAAQFRVFAPESPVLIYVGRGHNGGDGLVVARALATSGVDVSLRLAHPGGKLAPLTAKMLARIPPQVPRTLLGDGDYRKPAAEPAPRVIIDALLGLNAHGALRIPERAACREINALRGAHACVIALDLPSGVDAETGVADRDAVLAHHTLTVGFAKRGLVADDATNHVGRLHVVVLPEFTRAACAPAFTGSRHDELADAPALARLLPPRAFDTHKGDYGRVGVFAGSVGLSGAARLTATGALRGGAGLVTVFARRDIYPVLAVSCPPEAMVRVIDSPLEILETKLDVLAIGPGLGRGEGGAVRRVIEEFPGPAVVDADAISLLVHGESGVARLDQCAGPRVLTPHPGEMLRLLPESQKLRRAEKAARFVDRYRASTLLLKGARTIVAQYGHVHSFNPTGSPGMATGGMGDFLTGVIAALLGQHLSPFDAARLGAWLCGRAAELALAGGQSEESLLPDDLGKHLGLAFRDLHT